MKIGRVLLAGEAGRGVGFESEAVQPPEKSAKP
jgi:hypothetical protein